MTLPRRILLTLLVVTGIGGSSFGVAAMGGHLRLLTARSAMTVTLATRIDVANMAPGDTAQRLVTITNTSSRAITRMTFRVASPDAALSRSRRGLMVKLTLCSKPWTRRPTRAPSYTCSGIKKKFMGTRRLPIDRVLGGLPATPPGGKLYFRVITLLRPDAGNGLQGRRVTIKPTWLIGTAR